MSQITTAEGVAEELAARLATIRLADGAETDVGARVLNGRINVDDSMLPCVTLIDMGGDPEHRGPTTTALTRTEFVAFAYLACDPMQPNLAGHKALRDMKRAVFRTAGRASRDWGRRVHNVVYRGYEMGARSDGAAFLAVGLKVSVEFVEDVANP